jgi:hypothetical protein
MTPEQESALRVLRNEISDSIDGAEESRGRDSTYTRWVDLVDIALGRGIDPWARRALQPDLDAVKETK